MALPSRIKILDVGPRDGLQNEKENVSTAYKAQLVAMLQDAGLHEIEVTSFVSPKWVPQMGDNTAVMAAIARRADVRYSVLVPNLKGLEPALASRPDEILVFTAASEAFTQKNINCSIAESLERFAPVIEGAHAAGVKVRAALSCALGCPYEGDITADQVEAVVKPLRALGVDAIDIADTIGVGTPGKVQAAMARALKHFPQAEVSATSTTPTARR
jgi:hydroxymethylglutaryl-CoA lyase